MKTSAQTRNGLFVIIVAMLFTLLFSMDVMAKPKNAQDNGPKSLIREAAAAYEKGDFDTALAKFNEAYAIEPQSSILYNMGRVCESKADYQGAVAYYKQFLTAPGSDEDARVDAIDRIKNINETLSILGTPAGGAPAAPVAAPAPAVVAAAPVAAVPAPVGNCIDINVASSKQLEDLNGVGAATADKIIAARPYSSIDDLNKVKGLGPKKIDKMRSQICPIGAVAPAPAPAVVAKPSPAAKPAPAKAAPAAKNNKKADPNTIFDI